VNSKLAGIFFISATVAAIVGLKLYDPIIKGDDFLTQGQLHSKQIILGVVFELLLVISVLGTAIMLYPSLKKHSESWALGYVCFRVLEAVVILIGIVSVLALVSLRSAGAENFKEIENYRIPGQMLRSIRDWTFILGPNFLLGINTIIYSFIFYRSNMISRKLSIMGIFGSIFILIAAILEMFGVIHQISFWGVILALPIAVYEMVLALWLIVKGLK